MKKLTAVAVALMAATSAAQAAEVYKNEQMSLDMYGRIYAGQFFGDKKNGNEDYSAKIGANQFIRLGVKADSAITGTMKAIAQYETQMYIGDSEKINNVACTTTSTDANKDGNADQGTLTTTCQDDKLRTRLAFAGVKSDNFGQVTFGRQKRVPSPKSLTGPTSRCLTVTAPMRWATVPTSSVWPFFRPAEVLRQVR